jgi:Na+/melibiose symporter-like transporter
MENKVFGLRPFLFVSTGLFTAAFILKFFNFPNPELAMYFLGGTFALLLASLFYNVHLDNEERKASQRGLKESLGKIALSIVKNPKFIIAVVGFLLEKFAGISQYVDKETIIKIISQLMGTPTE